jgi:hypothetical protein
MTEAGDRKHAEEATKVDAGDPRSAAQETGIETEGSGRSSAPPLDDFDEIDLRESLRSALRPPPGSVAPSLLGGVQRKLRTRSRGKFYGDGWSTARSPRSTYLITSILMLVLIGLVFLVLVPWVGGALPLP